MLPLGASTEDTLETGSAIGAWPGWTGWTGWPGWNEGREGELPPCWNEGAPGCWAPNVSAAGGCDALGCWNAAAAPGETGGLYEGRDAPGDDGRPPGIDGGACGGSEAPALLRASPAMKPPGFACKYAA